MTDRNLLHNNACLAVHRAGGMLLRVDPTPSQPSRESKVLTFDSNEGLFLETSVPSLAFVVDYCL